MVKEELRRKREKEGEVIIQGDNGKNTKKRKRGKKKQNKIIQV